jgi:hypothetical protein
MAWLLKLKQISLSRTIAQIVDHADIAVLTYWSALKIQIARGLCILDMPDFAKGHMRHRWPTQEQILCHRLLIRTARRVEVKNVY